MVMRIIDAGIFCILSNIVRKCSYSCYVFLIMFCYTYYGKADVSEHLDYDDAVAL